MEINEDWQFLWIRALSWRHQWRLWNINIETQTIFVFIINITSTRTFWAWIWSKISPGGVNSSRKAFLCLLLNQNWMIWLRKSPNPFSFVNVRISLEFQHKAHQEILPLLDSFPDRSHLLEFLARRLSLAMSSFQGCILILTSIRWKNRFGLKKNLSNIYYYMDSRLHILHDKDSHSYSQNVF